MVKKVQIIKKDENIEEVGIQVRDGMPTNFDERRIFIDKNSGDIYVPKNGEYVRANISVFSSDPTTNDIPMWINDTENKIKWFDANNVMQEVDLSFKNNIASVTSVENFIDVLERLENGEQLEVVSNDRVIIELFNNQDFDHTNTFLDHSGIKVANEIEVGKIKKTVKSSGTSNYVEGVIKYQSSSLEPKSVVDNGDGTTTIIFTGNMTPYISNTQKFIVFEEFRPLITDEIEYGKFYEERREIEKKRSSYYLLKDLEPAILETDSMSYDANTNETTVVILNQGLNVSMGLTSFKNLRFMPFNIDVKGGSVVDSILLNQLELIEAYSETSDSSDVLGADATLKLIKNSATKDNFGKINWLSVAHSPNKKYWLIWAQVGIKSEYTNIVKIWYSNDGLATLHESDFQQRMANAGYSVPNTYWGATFDCYTDGQVSNNERNTHISDCGEVVFIHQYQPSASYSHNHFVTGRIDGEKGVFNYQGKTPWAQNSQISFETSGSYNYYCNTSAMDFETGILMASATRNTDDLYFQAWAVDFEKLEAHVIGHTPNLTDYAHHAFKGIGFWGDYEGERKFFFATRHTNNYWHGFSVKLYDIISEYRARDGGHRGGDIPRDNAFNTAIVTDGSHNKTRILDEIGEQFILTGYEYKNGVLTVWGADWDNNRNALAVIDFSKSGLKKSEDVLTFDSIPDDGELVVKLGRDNLNFHATEVTINSSSTAQTIEDAINSHDNNKCFFSNKYLDGELGQGYNPSPYYDRHLWGKWRRNNFLTKVFTTKEQRVSDGLILDKSKLFYSNYSDISVQTNTGLDAYFKVKGNFTYGPVLNNNPDFSDISGWSLGGDTATHDTDKVALNTYNRMSLDLVHSSEFSSIGQVGSWATWTPANLTDGDLSTWGCRTGSDPASDNNGRGIQYNFVSSKALKQISIYGTAVNNTSVICNYKIEYYDGSNWVLLDTLPSSEVTKNDGVLKFNSDGSVTSDKWRWYISDWVQNGTNFYVYETYAFEEDVMANKPFVEQAIATDVGEKYQIDADLISRSGDTSCFAYIEAISDDGTLLGRKKLLDHSDMVFVAIETSTKIRIIVDYDNWLPEPESSNVVDNLEAKKITSIVVPQTYLKFNLQDAQGDMRVVVNGTYLTYPKGSANGEYDANVTLSYYRDITALLNGDGVTDNHIEIKGTDNDHGTIHGIQIGAKSSKKMGIEFEVFTKAGIDHDVEFRIYEKDGTLKHTIVAGDSNSPTDTLQTITIGRDYLYGYGDYVECYSKSNSRDINDCYVRRSQNNFIAYSWREWEVTGDFSSGFTFRCQRPEPIALGTNTLTSGGSNVTPLLTNINGFENRSVVNSATLNAKYDDVKGCGVWLVSERLYNDMNYISSPMNAFANGARNNFNIYRNDNTIIASFSAKNGVGQPTLNPYIVKIPDYKEYTFKPLYYYNVGTTQYCYLTNNDGTEHAPNNLYGTRFAQSVVIPSNAGDNYADGMLPLRTLAIPMNIDHAHDRGWRYFEDDVYIRCKIVRMTAGYPDDSKVLGEAVNKIPCSELHSYSGTDAPDVYFNFDNLKLTPSAEVCIIIYVEGLDIESTTNAFAPRIKGNDAVSTLGGKFFREFQNVWSEQTHSMWFSMHDHYLSDIRFIHENGWNKNAKTVHPYTDYWRECTETTLYPIIDGSNIFTGTYRNTGVTNFNDNHYSTVRAGSKTYTYSVKDLSQFSPLNVSEPSIVEVETNNSFDENLVMAIVPKDFCKVEIDQKGIKKTFTTRKTYDGILDYHFNRSLSIGGSNLDYSSWIDTFRQIDLTGYTHGIFKTDTFKYGNAFSMMGTKMYSYYDSRVFCPYHREFIWEMEIEPDATDLDGSQNMLFSSLNLFYISIHPLNGTPRYSFYNASHWGPVTGYTYTAESVPNSYHRLRIIRSHTDGLKIFRNFTKDDENAWEELTQDTSTVPWLWGDLSHGTQIGRNDESRNYFAIGGYTENNDYNYHGKIGYVKMAIGTTEFKTSEIVRVHPFIRPSNKGNIIFGLRNYYDCYQVHQHTSCDIVYTTPKFLGSSLKDTQPQYLKFKGNLTNIDRNNTIEIEMTKKSENDPTTIKGMFFNFERR